MTTAVCLKCGHLKIGALVCCSQCGHTPTDSEDKARHMLLSDRFLSREELEKAASDVRSGTPIFFDSQHLQDLLDVMPGTTESRKVLWLMLLVIALLFLLLIAGGSLLLRALLGPP